MTSWFNPDDEKTIDDIFDVLHEKLLLLDRKNEQAERQAVEISKLDKEKSEACNELESLKTLNLKLQDELKSAAEVISNAQKQISGIKAENNQLRRENVELRSENEKISMAQNKMTAQFTELQGKHVSLLEKVSIWHKVHDEISQKQAQNQIAMLETAKQIGHAKASTLYIHQLKHQVEVVYKNALDTIKRLQEPKKKTKMEHEGSNEVTITNGEEEAVGSSATKERTSGWNDSELYWKGVNERLRTELLSYKEELWSGLQALSQLSDIKGPGPY